MKHSTINGWTGNMWGFYVLVLKEYQKVFYFLKHCGPSLVIIKRVSPQSLLEKLDMDCQTNQKSHTFNQSQMNLVRSQTIICNIAKKRGNPNFFCQLNEG